MLGHAGDPFRCARSGTDVGGRVRRRGRGRRAGASGCRAGDGGGAPGERRGEGARPGAAAGQEAGEHRVAGADRADRVVDRASPWTRRRSASTSRAPSAPRLARTARGPAVAQRAARRPRASPTVRTRRPVASASSSRLGLTRSGPAASAASSGAPLVSSATRTPRRPAAPPGRRRSRRGSRAAGCRTARPRRRPRPRRRSRQRQAVDLGGRAGAGPASLSLVVVPSGSTSVTLLRIGAGDRDRRRRRRPGRRSRRGRAAAPSAPPQGSTARVGTPCGGQRAGDVDALAAGVDARSRSPAGPRRGRAVDLEGAVQARVGGEGDDHAAHHPRGRRRPGPAASAASRPVSVMRTSTSSSAPKRAKWSSPTLVWSASTTRPAARRRSSPA